MSVISHPHYEWFTAMHTRIDILLYSNANQDLKYIVATIRDEIKRIENFANRFDPHSELSIINRTAFPEPVAISAELYWIIEDCIYFCHLTQGTFDVTVNSHNHLKDGISQIDMNISEQTICYRHPDVQIDLSGYIKGYALFKIRELLAGQDIENALISLGNSSIMALGNHPYGHGWNIGGTTLSDKCLTSSGNTREHLHIIYPQTGEYVLPSDPVSVVTDDPIVGEVLSTFAYCNHVHIDTL